MTSINAPDVGRRADNPGIGDSGCGYGFDDRSSRNFLGSGFDVALYRRRLDHLCHPFRLDHHVLAVCESEI